MEDHWKRIFLHAAAGRSPVWHKLSVGPLKRAPERQKMCVVRIHTHSANKASFSDFHHYSSLTIAVVSG